MIPSISAITGVTPQTYMWRIAVAFHVGPRMVIAQVYYNYFISQMSKVVDKSTSYILINLCYWLNLIEIAAICGVTYISNRENYRTSSNLSYCYILIYCILSTITFTFFSFLLFLAVHEKIFILFMLSSLLYMIVMIKTFNMMHKTMTEHQRLSYNIKKILFAICITSTFTLIIYFIKHRFYCHDLGNVQHNIKILINVCLIISIFCFYYSIYLVCTQ